MAIQTGINLIFHGESPFEYGTNDLKSINASGFEKEYFAGSQDPQKSLRSFSKEHLRKTN